MTTVSSLLLLAFEVYDNLSLEALLDRDMGVQAVLMAQISFAMYSLETIVWVKHRERTGTSTPGISSYPVVLCYSVEELYIISLCLAVDNLSRDKLTLDILRTVFRQHL